MFERPYITHIIKPGSQLTTNNSKPAYENEGGRPIQLFCNSSLCVFLTKLPKNNAPYKLDTFLCLQMGIEPRPSRMMTEEIWLASNSANGEFSLLPLILCMKLKAHHEWRWLMPLDWPLTYLIKSCGLSTEFLASNSANDVHSVSGMKSKAEDINTICWVGGSSFITFLSYKTK